MTTILQFNPMVSLPPVVAAPDIAESMHTAATPPSVSTTPAITEDGTVVTPDSLTIVTPPAHGTASVSGVSLVYTPAANFAGLDSFTYYATKSGINSNTATVSVSVSPPTFGPKNQKLQRLLADIYADTTLDCYVRNDAGPIDLTGYQLTAHLHPYNRPQPFGQDYGVGWPGIYVPWHTEFPAEQLEVGHVQFTVDHGTIHQRLGPGMFTMHLVAVDPVSLSRTRVYTALLTIQ
jgi:hypothetical protein